VSLAVAGRRRLHVSWNTSLPPQSAGGVVVAAAAVDRGGRELGRSRPVRL